MQSSQIFWNIPLGQRPCAALIALGRHGPNIVERFRSQQHWWLHLYRYTATLRLDGQMFSIHPGCVSLIAPGVEIEYGFSERATHLCAHFSLPLAPAGENPSIIPAMQSLEGDFASFDHALNEAAVCFATNPLRAEVRLWDILWQLAQRRQAQSQPLLHAYPSYVQQARQLIELRLGETFSVKELAKEVGVSHNHLTRLFHQSVGDSVIGYIRGRRVERARHLLQHTTLPIRLVAEQVGVNDVRHFYKMIQAYLGVSPSEVRAGKTMRTAWEV